MKLRISNQLNMVGTCITVAQSAEYAPVWSNREPIAFTNGIAQVQVGYVGLTDKATLVENAGTGAADAKAVAEGILESRAYILARALAVHFKNTGDVARRVHVDVSRSEIVRLRENELVTKTSAIRDIAAVVQSEEKASEQGVTPARVAALTAAIDTFKKALMTPRGQIVNRSTLSKELETDIAALVDKLHDLDDLVLQFEGSPTGDRFIEAWKSARMIIDRPGELSKPTPSPILAATPAT